LHQAYHLLDGSQLFHQNILSFAVSLKATEFFRICAYFVGFWELDQVAFQVLHQVVVEAAALQELESVVSRAYGFELEAVLVLIVVVRQRAGEGRGGGCREGENLPRPG
jgi:hypothetical protein